MSDKIMSLNAGVAFDNIDDMLAVLGWIPDMSPKAQRERRAWQDEAAMSHAERMAALEARRAKAGIK